MHIKALTVAVAGCAALLGGCSLYEMRWGKNKPPISYSLSNDYGIVAWKPDSSAAYIFPPTDGITSQACVASADVAKSLETNTAIAGTVELAQKGQISANVARAISEQITILTNKGAAGAYLNVALFGICMLNGPNRFTHEELTKLVTHALDKAAEIATTQHATVSQEVTAPAPNPAPTSSSPTTR